MQRFLSFFLLALLVCTQQVLAEAILINAGGGAGANSFARDAGFVFDECDDDAPAPAPESLSDGGTAFCNSTRDDSTGTGTGTYSFSVTEVGGAVTQVELSASSFSNQVSAQGGAAQGSSGASARVELQILAPVLISVASVACSHSGDESTGRAELINEFSGFAVGFGCVDGSTNSVNSFSTEPIQVFSGTVDIFVSAQSFASTSIAASGNASGSILVTIEPLILEGACCLSEGVCDVRSQQECDTAGGSYLGNFSECESEGGGGAGNKNICPAPSGACCLPSGNCSFLTEAECLIANGTYQGDNVSCGGVGTKLICPVITGACCLPDRSCEALSEEECQQQGGLYKGDNAACSTANCDCTLQWDVTSGAFEQPSNWNPEAAPTDNGDGCADLILNQPGDYDITISDGAEADSLTVLQGDPTLLGGSLTLGGKDSIALSVGGEGSLEIGSGTVQADSALINGVSPLLSLRPGAVLSVITALETARDATQLGSLSLDAEDTATALSVAGNATLGGGGSSVVTGAGALSFNVLGDLSMAVFPGSSSQLVLGEITETPEGTVQLGVGDTFDIGGGGAAVATFDGEVVATAGAVNLGLLEGASGTLNLNDGASLAVDGQARIGVEGVGEVFLDASTLSADTLLVSGPKPQGGGAKADEASFLNVGSGSSLTVTTLFETARDAGDVGQLDLGDGDEAATVSVAGNMVLGGGGESLANGQGPLTLGVLGDMSLAVFPGSQSQLLLGDSTSQFANEIAFTVGGALKVGGGGAAAATLDGEVTATAGALDIGLVQGGTGILNVAAGASLAVSSTARVGVAGIGTLNISNGGSFSATGLTVDGKAGEVAPKLNMSNESVETVTVVNVSDTLTVGKAQRGEWTMDGNTELNADFIVLGEGVSTSGTATFASVDAVGEEDIPFTKVKAKQLMVVGQQGSGSFITTGAALHEFGSVLVAASAGSNGDYIAQGALNSTTILDDLVVGSEGTGALELRTGGISAGACIVGKDPGGFGIVRLSDAGALIVSPPSSPEGETEGARKSNFSTPGFLEIGRRSNGIIELFDEGTRLRCVEAIIGGDNSGAGGTLGVDTGAIFECGFGLTLGANEGPALVRVANNATMTVGGFILIGPKGLFIAGGAANVSSSSVVNNGRLRVVNEVIFKRALSEGHGGAHRKGGGGPAVFDGDLQIGPDGVLEIEAGAGEALVVTGAATLDGTLEITLQPGVTFTDDQLLDLIAFQGGTTGSFASVTFLNAPEGFEGNVEFEDGILRLRVVTGGTVEPEGEGQASAIHSADQNSDQSISLSELLRVIQFYNALGFHCIGNEGESEDGYVAGLDETAEDCAPHDTDFDGQDWVITVNELLRLVQLYNAGGYLSCENGEDGFCLSVP